MKYIFATAPFLVIALCTWLCLSGSSLATTINRWQSDMMGDHKYFPALTIFIMAIPPLLLLLALKKILYMKVSQKS